MHTIPESNQRRPTMNPIPPSIIPHLFSLGCHSHLSRSQPFSSPRLHSHAIASPSLNATCVTTHRASQRMKSWMHKPVEFIAHSAHLRCRRLMHVCDMTYLAHPVLFLHMCGMTWHTPCYTFICVTLLSTPRATCEEVNSCRPRKRRRSNLMAVCVCVCVCLSTNLSRCG